MVLLVLTVVAAKVPLPGTGNIAVALGIAVVKAALNPACSSCISAIATT